MPYFYRELKEATHTDKSNVEVFFPKVFTAEHPWPAGDPNFFQQGETTIPIFQLSHVTHEEEAKSIKASNGFAYLPKMEFGKTPEWDSSPPGKTYRKVGADRYDYIPYSWDDPIFPGNISWWGIDTRYWYENETEGKELSERVRANQGNNRIAPSYLAPEVGSP